MGYCLRSVIAGIMPQQLWQKMTDIAAHQDELRRLATLYWLGLTDSAAVDSWVLAEYEHNANPDPSLSRLLSHDNDAEHLLCRFAQSQLAFVPASNSGVEVAQSLLVTYLRRFLNKEIQPHALCSLVNAIDGQFLGALPTVDPGVAYYPAWLGDLWNCCEYCDIKWTFESEPYLVQESQKVLAQLTGGTSVV